MAKQPSSSARTETVKSYVSPQLKEEIEREADRRDLSTSSLVEAYCRRGLRQDREDELAAETEAARRLGDVLDQGLDDFQDTARHIQNLNAKTGVYAVAAFELLKREYPEQTVKKALQTGSRRLRADDPPELVEDRDDPADSSGSSLRDRLRRDDG